jgi:hypothetical protein
LWLWTAGFLIVPWTLTTGISPKCRQQGPNPWILLHLSGLGLFRASNLTVLHACMCAVQVAGMYHSARKEKLFCTCHVVWR